MTTTPGPRTEAGKRLWTQIQGGVTALFHDDPVIGEAILAIEAEARADVDGLVAQIAELGWTGLPQYAIAYAAAIRDVLALLAGDKAEAPRKAQIEGIVDRFVEQHGDALTALAGDKAEAPE